MASKIEVNLDTSKELYGMFKCKQNDDLLLIANIYENGASKDLTNCSIVVQAKKADNTYIIQNTDITKDKNKFIANLVRDFTRVPGQTLIEVVLVESSKQNTTFSFCLEVIGSVIKGAEESKDLITSLEVMQDAVVEMGKISEETKELIKNSGAASKEEMNKVNASLADVTLNKADIKYVNDKITTSQKAIENYNGSLEELNNTSPNIDKNYLITKVEDTENYGYVCYHNGNSFVKGWKFQSYGVGENEVKNINIDSKSIHKRNLGFLFPEIKSNINLLDSFIVGARFNNSNGELIPSRQDYFSTFNKIPVNAGDRYYSNAGSYCGYNEKEGFVEGYTINSSNFTIPEGVAFIHLNFLSTIEKPMLCLFENWTKKEKFYSEYWDYSLKRSDEVEFKVEFKNGVISVVDGVRTNTSKGEITESTTSKTTDVIIDVEPNTKYSTNATGVIFYDKNGAYIKGYPVTDGEFTSGSTTYKIHLNFPKDIGKFYINIPFERIDIKNLRITKENFDDGIDIGNIQSIYKDKYISFLGDSISTYIGYNPEGNEVYYKGNNAGVSSVEQTWWKKLINALGMKLCVNNSWSGSRVTTTRDTYPVESAGVTRCTNLHTDSITPDVIIVYIGFNDFLGEVDLGTYNGTQEFPTDTTKFRESYSIMLNTILTQYKNAEVWICTLPQCEREQFTTSFPEKNANGVLLNEYNKIIRELADLFGVKVLEHNKCGLTYQNVDIYMGDYGGAYTGSGLHPNAKGHSLIANNDIRQMDSAVRIRY